VAGLLQTFRDPAPPSIVGQFDGANLETAEALWDGQFHDTYLSVGVQRLIAERNRRVGLFVTDDPDYVAPPSLGTIRERVRFREHALDLSAHQLLGEEWSFGMRYRLGYAQLKRSFPEYPGLGIDLDDRTDWRGWLHTLNLSALYRHRSGFFARTEGSLFAQDREREGNALRGDDFWQVNLIAGYRFPKQNAEIAVGVLNLLDFDYKLDPINQHAHQPRSRTLYARLLINF
jgi:hypothetical protein